MARARKKTGTPQTYPNGMSKKQMKRKKPIDSSYMVPIKPLTDNQTLAFENYEMGKNLLLHGAAGTGKTFITLYLALQEVLDENTPYDKIYIVRSLVPTREIGFLLETMKISLPCIKFHTRIWSGICLVCLMIIHLTCFMTTSEHKKLFHFGLLLLSVELLLTMPLLLSMSFQPQLPRTRFNDHPYW